MEDMTKTYATGDRIVGPSETTPARNPQPEDVVMPEPEMAQAEPEKKEPVQTSSKETNLRVLRERAEKMEHERNQAMQRLAELEARAQGINPPDQESSLRDDDIPEWRHVAKEIKKLKDELKQYQHYSSTNQAEIKLRNDYPDIEKVVSKENLAVLAELHPEIAETLRANPDLYSKGKAAYKIIKNMGIHTEDTYEPDRDRAQRNAAKPRPLASMSPQQAESPLSQVNAFENGLTEELKRQLYKEMVQAAKNR